MCLVLYTKLNIEMREKLNLHDTINTFSKRYYIRNFTKSTFKAMNHQLFNQDHKTKPLFRSRKIPYCYIKF